LLLVIGKSATVISYQLYFGSARCARPLPRNCTGHIAHPFRSIVLRYWEANGY
jgi:hypothetical protein